MAIHPGLRAPSQPTSPLETLIRRRGLNRFGLFFVTGEGELLPNGDEEKSGYVISDAGKIFRFWTGWDADRQEVVLADWEPVDEEEQWREVGEYQRARSVAGLPPTVGESPKGSSGTFMRVTPESIEIRISIGRGVAALLKEGLTAAAAFGTGVGAVVDSIRHLIR